METARIKILQRLRRALKTKNSIPYPELDNDQHIFPPTTPQLDVLFAEQLKAVDGHFMYCESTAAFIANLEQLIHIKKWKHLHCWDARLLHLFKQYNFQNYNQDTTISKGAVGIGSCSHLIARTGSILVNSSLAGGRTLSIAPDVHIVVAHQNQLVYTIKEALQQIHQNHEILPSMISLITGASRTADIEKTLVMGAHGPKELYVFLLDN